MNLVLVGLHADGVVGATVDRFGWVGSQAPSPSLSGSLPASWSSSLTQLTRL